MSCKTSPWNHILPPWNLRLENSGHLQRNKKTFLVVRDASTTFKDICNASLQLQRKNNVAVLKLTKNLNARLRTNKLFQKSSLCMHWNNCRSSNIDRRWVNFVQQKFFTFRHNDRWWIIKNKEAKRL